MRWRMSKICGYSCKHNKSGVCQISVCDKQLIMSDKTEVQTFTRYIDTTTTELQQENKQLQERVEYLERSNNRREDTILEQRQKISDLEDNWNKLKKFLEEWKENEEYCYLASNLIDRCRKDIYG